MSEKSSTLFSRLKKYIPTNEALSKEVLIQKILHSLDYQRLQKSTAFAPYFEEHFERDRLKEYSLEKLKQIEETMPLVATAMEGLAESIENGAGSQLLPSDRPDFMNKESLEHIVELLHDSSGKNYSNIPSDKFMQLFEKSTVKLLGKRFAELPFGCKDYENAIASLFPSQYFCISETEIREQEKAFQESIAQLEAEKESIKTSRQWCRLFKILLGFCLCVLPGLVWKVTGALSVGLLAVSLLIEIALVIIFWIKG